LTEEIKIFKLVESEEILMLQEAHEASGYNTRFVLTNRIYTGDSMSASNADLSENYFVCPLSLFYLKKQLTWLKKTTYLAFSIIYCQRYSLAKKAWAPSLNFKIPSFLFVENIFHAILVKIHE